MPRLVARVKRIEIYIKEQQNSGKVKEKDGQGEAEPEQLAQAGVRDSVKDMHQQYGLCDLGIDDGGQSENDDAAVVESEDENDGDDDEPLLQTAPQPMRKARPVFSPIMATTAVDGTASATPEVTAADADASQTMSKDEMAFVAASTGLASGRSRRGQQSQPKVAKAPEPEHHLAHTTTIVIGAGLVGLFIARELAMRVKQEKATLDHQVVIVEARPGHTQCGSYQCAGLINSSNMPSAKFGTLHDLSQSCWKDLLAIEGMRDRLRYNSRLLAESHFPPVSQSGWMTDVHATRRDSSVSEPVIERM